MCPSDGGAYSGDTILSLYNNQGNDLAWGDYDWSCGYYSKLSYSFTGDYCQYYSLYQGCGYDWSCSGTTAIVVTGEQSIENIIDNQQ